MTTVKFCGLTRPVDTEAAVAAGGSHVGVIFAGGPRDVSVARALEVLAPARGRALAVGVFGASDAQTIAATARDAALDVVQLHADPQPEDVEALRARFSGPVWAAHRVDGVTIEAAAAALFATADAVVLDARVPGSLGGTGHTLDWEALADGVAAIRGRGARLVLAGGLRPDNVRDALRWIDPDVVDVSSGVEAAPGIKDHQQMGAFVEAVRTAATAPRSAGR